MTRTRIFEVPVMSWKDALYEEKQFTARLFMHPLLVSCIIIVIARLS